MGWATVGPHGPNPWGYTRPTMLKTMRCNPEIFWFDENEELPEKFKDFFCLVKSSRFPDA